MILTFDEFNNFCFLSEKFIKVNYIFMYEKKVNEQTFLKILL